MKTCPVCQSIAFDDAEVCYGCLHQFTKMKDPLPSVTSRAITPDDDAAQIPSSEPDLDKSATEAASEELADTTVETTELTAETTTKEASRFTISFTPQREETGDLIWQCTVETSPLAC